MKALFVSGLLLATASTHGALTSATGDRLTDYTNWFAPEFSVASDANYLGVPYPPANVPAAFADANRAWSGWTPNWAPGLSGPIVTPASPGWVTKVEFVFLGETAAWWDDIGYRLNGVEYLLADGVQAAGPVPNRQFGDYAELSLAPGDTLDFFITGSGDLTQDGEITTGSTGGKYFVFDQSLNTPAFATKQSYFGSLTPLTNTRPVDPGSELSGQSFTVVGFEESSTDLGVDSDYNDLVFAFRVSNNNSCVGCPVPESSTYGVIGAAVLLGLSGWRRLRRS